MKVVGWAIGFIVISILTKSIGLIPAFILGVVVAAGVNMIFLKSSLGKITRQGSELTSSDNVLGDNEKTVDVTQTRKIILSVAAVLIVSIIFIHNPFSGYITSDEVLTGGEYQATTIPVSECYLLFAIGDVQRQINDNSRAALSLMSSGAQLTRIQSEKLAQYNKDAQALNEKLNELRARESAAQFKCTWIDKYTTYERDFLKWESKSPVISGLRSVASFIYVVSFVVMVFSVILVVAGRQD